MQKGEKIIELDASSLEDQINTQLIAFNKAKTTVIQAEKDFEVAKISVKEYIEGTFVKELEDANIYFFAQYRHICWILLFVEYSA